MRERPLCASDRVYRWLLRAYPAAFREEFGAEMALVFRDRCREVAGRRGACGLGALWWHTLGDFGISVVTQRLDSGEATVNGKTIVGLVMVLYAVGNIVYDAMFDWARMGWVALLATVLAAAVGGWLAGRNWRRAAS